MERPTVAMLLVLDTTQGQSGRVMGAGSTPNNPGPLGTYALCHRKVSERTGAPVLPGGRDVRACYWASLRPRWGAHWEQGVGVTQGARQLLMVLGVVQSQRRREQAHGGSGCCGPLSMLRPHLPAGQGLLQPSLSACSCRMSSEDSQQSLLGEGRRLNFSCLPKCYCLYGPWKSVLWPALFVH